MDEITKLYKARITVLEMMNDRGIDYPSTLNIDKIEQFRIEYYSRNIDIFINHQGQRIFIKFLINSKIKPKISPKNPLQNSKKISEKIKKPIKAETPKSVDKSEKEEVSNTYENE